jgi:hypothetical protein
MLELLDSALRTTLCPVQVVEYRFIERYTWLTLPSLIPLLSLIYKPQYEIDITDQQSEFMPNDIGKS